MTNTAKTAPARWFLPVAGLALIWNVIGIAAYLNQMSMDLYALPAAQQAFYASIPTWATAAFAVAVFAGVIGALGLVLRKAWALQALVASLIGIVVQMTHTLVIGDGLVVFGPTAMLLPLATLAIGLGLTGLAVVSKKRRWI